MAWPQVRRVTLLAIAGLLALPTLRYLPPFLDCPPALTPPARALRPPAAPSPPPSAPGPAPGPWLTLPWAEAFGTRTCDNALFCYIAPDVTLVVADAVALSPHAVLLLGLYRVPGHGGVAPALRCAAPGAGATHARAYTTTVFTEEKRFKTYTWRGVPFSYFDALCEWPDPVLRPGAITVLTVSGVYHPTGECRWGVRGGGMLGVLQVQGAITLGFRAVDVDAQLLPWCRARSAPCRCRSATRQTRSVQGLVGRCAPASVMRSISRRFASGATARLAWHCGP